MRSSTWLVVLALSASACAGGSRRAAQEEAAERPAPAGAEAWSADGAIERARDLERAGRRDAAEEVYRDALHRPGVSDHDAARLHLHMALLMAQEGRVENGLEHAAVAHKLRPDWDDAEHVLEKLKRRSKLEHAGREAASAKAAKDGAPNDAGWKKAFSKEHAAEKDVAAALEARKAKKKAALAGDLAKEKAARKEKAAAGDAAAELAALRKTAAEMKETAHRIEMERDLLRARVHELEAEAAALRDRVAALEQESKQPK